MKREYELPEEKWAEDPFSWEAITDQETMIGMGLSAWAWVIVHMKMQILDLQRRLEKMETRIIKEQTKEDE